MTGRKSTRAVSSRASSIAGSDVGLPTPRRSARNHPILDGSPLPPPLPELAAVPFRGSTSYGSSVAALPVDFRRVGHGGDLTETLTDILGTVQENIQATYGQSKIPAKLPDSSGTQAASESEVGSRGRGRRATSKAPAVNIAHDAGDSPATGRSRGRGQASSVPSTPDLNNTISYLNESALYGDATFTEDAATAPRRLGRRAAKALIEEYSQQDILEPITNRVSLWMLLNAWIGNIYKLTVSSAKLLGTRIFGTVSSVTKSIIFRWDIVVFLMILATVAIVLNTGSTREVIFEDELQPTGFGIMDRIQQWIPSSASRSLSYLNDLDISNLQGRMSVVENELFSIKKHIALDREALEDLRRMLPEEMYLSKENGEAELPPNLWKALIEKSQNLFKDKSATISRSDWDDFISQNEAKVKAWQAEVSEEFWAQHLQEALKDGGVLVSKAAVMEMIQKRWEQSETLIKKQVQNEMGNVAKVFRQPATITKQEAIDLYNELTVKAFAQNEDSKNFAYYSLQRPNHFSFGLGAVINPSVTSPTYAFAKARAWWPKRLILWGVGFGMPTPNPPAEALRKWDEAGDCWCSPAKGSGAGVQLGVLMASNIFPKEIVIEHIPSSATLDSTAAPLEMELVAEINGFKAQGTVGELSDKIFPDFYEKSLGKEWILIGTWRYNTEADNHIQHFYPQIDLKALGVSTKQLVVRAKSNQGNSDHTCLYRVRVYGDVAEKDAA